MAITVSNTFVPATAILSAEVNENFQDIIDQAVAKTGDTMTGTLTVPSLSVTGTTTSSTITVALAIVTSTSATALDVAGGINAGSGNVGIVGTDGRIPAISTTYFASLDGSNLTGLANHDSENNILASQVFG